MNNSKMEDAIRNRLVNGFKNWNGGYDEWLEWCNTLYEPDAHYNVYGKRLTLQEYKDMMGQLFQHYTIELGKFENMIIKDDWCAIRYVVKIKNLHTGEEVLQHTMEFVNFKENPRSPRCTCGGRLGSFRQPAVCPLTKETAAEVHRKKDGVNQPEKAGKPRLHYYK